MENFINAQRFNIIDGDDGHQRGPNGTKRQRQFGIN